MTPVEQLVRLRPEVRRLRIRNAQLERAYLYQKQKNTLLEDIIAERERIIKELEKERDKLTKWIDDLKQQKETYKGMVYKPNRSIPAVGAGEKKSVGGQEGHRGYGRPLPCAVDRNVSVFAPYCPHCHTPLARSKRVTSHIVEDIPSPQHTRVIVTRYTSERQWCTTCKKEVVSLPRGVIPNSRFGTNLTTQLLVWRYRCRLPFAIIAGLFATTYGIHISQGALAKALKRTSRYLGTAYGDILKRIRAAPIKHADETGWRIKGVNSWAWAFLSKQEVYYTIEESRGGGIAQKILADGKPTDVLVRDDYVGYKNLHLRHQSCWAHLLRKSHEATIQEKASEEVKTLHAILKTVYQQLQEATAQSLTNQERTAWYQKLAATLHAIQTTTYQYDDARKIQLRITHQGTNLLTALLSDGVPLTNNAAERAIRPLVVTRKISGGSRSDEGAATHAINMSILQTIRMRNQPLFATLHDAILQGSLQKGE